MIEILTKVYKASWSRGLEAIQIYKPNEAPTHLKPFEIVLMLNFWRKAPEGSPLRKCDKDLKLEFGNSEYILCNKNLTSTWLPWTCESRFRFYGYLKLRDNDILPIQIIFFSFINDKCSCKTVILWKSSRCSHVKYMYLYNPPWVTSRKFVNTVRHVTAIKPMKRAQHTKFTVT